MTKLMIFKVLAATAVVAGGSAVALQDKAQVSVEPEQGREYHASMQTAAPSAAPKFEVPAAAAVEMAEARVAAAAEPQGADEPECPQGNDPECGGEPGDAPIRVVDGRGEVVDADAQDPELIAKKFGLDPRGSTDPVVSIVECTDYDCPYCKKARGTVDRIIADYGDKVAVYELQNPLPFHPGADPAARAVIAAGQQHKLWEMSDLIFDDQSRRSDADFEAFADDLGLDVAQFKRDYESEETAAAVEEQKKTCLGNGGRGTPSFFINGDILVGAQPYEKFQAMIDDELASSK